MSIGRGVKTLEKGSVPTIFPFKQDPLPECKPPKERTLLPKRPRGDDEMDGRPSYDEMDEEAVGVATGEETFPDDASFHWRVPNVGNVFTASKIIS